MKTEKVMKERTSKGERIGGGWIVIKRELTQARLTCAFFPFEHDTREAAVAQAEALGVKYTEAIFEVFHSSGDIHGHHVGLYLEARAQKFGGA